MFAEVAAVMAVELENAAMLGLTGDPLVVTVPLPEGIQLPPELVRHLSWCAVESRYRRS
jgi:hypothetical protein